MKFITVSELKNKATQVVTELEETKGEIIVTKNGKPVVLMQFITDESLSLTFPKNERDQLYYKALEYADKEGQVSIQALQRKFLIVYSRAARYMELMEEDGLLKPTKEGQGKKAKKTKKL